MRDGNDVHLCEVGLRDGLQNVKTFFPTAAKIVWLEAEAAAGMPEIEACSFVPPKLIPQFSDCLEVLEPALKLEGVLISALIPNLKGAERSEEHTSELQSLMRISYAVFCLKKTIKTASHIDDKLVHTYHTR